jgi:ABC-type Mn2+/Zn2+ transport system ATPase subunit
VPAVGDLADSAALEGVYKRFARRAPWVLNGVDLTLRPGTGTFVTGTNGSGKSTLLRIVAGLSRPTRGTAKRATTASFLPERQPESLRMTGTSYLAHFARMRSLDPLSARSRIRDLLDRLGLEPGPDVPIEELSKGNRQKVLIAQAFLCPVQLIVLDEPLSGLDARAQKAFHRLVADARDTGSAILMSGHDEATAPEDFKPYELVEGREDEQTAARPFTTSAKMVVALTGPTALDHLVLSSIPGVDIDSSGGGVSGDNGRTVVAYVDRTATDRFLAQAISAGWSVVSVSGKDRQRGPRDGQGESR